MLNRNRFLSLCLIIVLYPVAAHAENGSEGGLSADDIAKKLADPNTTLGSLSFSLDHIAYTGNQPQADEQKAWKLSFQPSLPYKLAEDMNLFVRPLIPIILDLPVPVVGDQSVLVSDTVYENRGAELGDIGFDVAIGKNYPGGLVVIGGLVGTLPTATDDDLGLGQYLLGPEFAVAKVSDWGVIGILLSHQWDVAGDDDFNTNISGGQYFFTYNLENAWQISMQPTFSYNHEAASGQELTFPLGIGVSKTTLFGKTPWKFSLQYWEYIEKPDAFGPDYQIRFTVTPVVPLPW